MILKETLKKAAIEQRKQIESADIGISRDITKSIDLKVPHVIILSGIRRCGKSTFLRQLLSKTSKSCYFNFEDQRVFGFSLNDFERLDEVLREVSGDVETYFFDEIQNVAGWERFIRKMHDFGKKFIITGSNASLLSKELGTKLTGRHIRYELFPFSYNEMLLFTNQKPSLNSFKIYMENGGFPEFLEYKKVEMLQELLTDILTRDIIVRHGIREEKVIKELAIYLLTNVGNEFSYTKLSKQFNIGSTNTTISYISYLEDSYLLFTVPMFDYSYRKQLVNPKKIYSIDVGLSRANSASFSEDLGRVLENMVFLHLKRKYKDIFYYRGKRECDFLVKEKGKLKLAVQVCLKLDEENKEREIEGLKEAMSKLQIKNGFIITLDQADEVDGIKFIPAWKWLINNVE